MSDAVGMRQSGHAARLPRFSRGSLLVNLASLEARDVDLHLPQRIAAGYVFDEGDTLLFLVEHLDGQPQALQLFHQYLERLRHARLEDVLTLDDRLVGL